VWVEVGGELGEGREGAVPLCSPDLYFEQEKNSANHALYNS
jgi:hypothetical protein